MILLRLLAGGEPGARRRVLLVAALAGLANATLIGLANAVAAKAARGEPVGLMTAWMYGVAMATFLVAQRASMRLANGYLEGRLAALRRRVFDKIRRSELRTLEGIGRGELFTKVAQETNHLSQNFPMLITAAQAVVLLAFCLAYIAYLSPVSSVVISLVVAGGLAGFACKRRALVRALVAVTAREGETLDALADFLEGFQEVRLHADRSDALRDRFAGVVAGLREAVLGVGDTWVGVLMFSNSFMFALLGAITLVLPMFFSGYTGVIYELTAAAFFCTGPVMIITGVAPVYTKAAVGLRQVYDLEAVLDAGRPPVKAVTVVGSPGAAAGGPRPPDAATPGAGAADEGGPALPDEEPDPAPRGFGDFRAITAEAVTFHYRHPDGARGFGVGPLDLRLGRGEVLFLRGGNGSGKSTVLKLFTGLYPVAGGALAVDGVPVTAADRDAYRGLFSAVFTDFHLFDRLHGLDHVPADRVAEVLARLELTGKVRLEGGRFGDLGLSTGQRKRLALAVALLEDRPILVLDEWAADQERRFRQVFYTELIPAWRAAGKTVVVATHDEAYYDRCDRLLHLDLGRLRDPAAAGGGAS